LWSMMVGSFSSIMASKVKLAEAKVN
jgi:hypothetical protein